MAKVTINIITEDKGQKQEKTMEFTVKDLSKRLTYCLWKQMEYGCIINRRHRSIMS